RLDFSPGADFLARRLEDHQAGGDRLAVLVAHLAADGIQRRAAAAAAGTQEEQEYKGPGAPRAPGTSVGDDGSRGHHPASRTVSESWEKQLASIVRYGLAVGAIG